MYRIILLAVAVFSSTVPSNVNDEYVVHLDAVGYVDQPITDNPPKETVLHSIEVIARPDTPFHAKIIFGKESLTLSGKLLPAQMGDFAADVRYLHTVDTGSKVPTEGGGEEPVLGITEIQTTVTTNVGEQTILGGMETKAENETTSGKTALQSKTLCKLTVTKYVPTEKGAPTEQRQP